MLNCCANSASVLSPRTAAKATFALKAGVWFRRGRFVMVSPVRHTSWPLSGRNSTYPAVQISKASSVRQCMKYGVEFIFHATFATDDTIEQLEKVKHKHYVSPAIAARYNTTYEASDWGITTDVADIIGNKRELEEGIKVMQKMRAAGIKVLPFGDYGFAWLPHGTEARDLEHFVNLFGYEPWEVLRAATAWGGEAWAGKSGEKMGRVQPGYLADILLVDGNPLYDLSLLQDRNALLAIMKDGSFYKPFQGRAAAQQAIAAE